MKLAAAALLVLILNLPFGYWRSSVGRFSLAWFAAIHIPVPAVIALRSALFGWDYTIIAVFVAAYAAGQAAGTKVRDMFARDPGPELGSFLMRDVYRRWRHRRNP